MFEKSTHEIEKILQSIEERLKETQQLKEKKQKEYEETRQQNMKIIDNSKTLPVERLRALVMNVILVDEVIQVIQERRTLFLGAMVANSMKIFQLEVATEFLRAQNKLPISQGQEGKGYEEMEKELRRIKSLVDEEWKPIMEGLKDELDNRKKFLDANR